MPEKPLAGKIAIVTGAASPRGLGRSMTEALVRAGAHVAMMDINQEWLDETSNYMQEIGGDRCVTSQVVDVSSFSEAERSVKQTIEELGGLHILVNNAGIAPQNMLLGTQSKNNFWEVSPEEWDRVVSVNSNGPFYMTRSVVPHMIKQKWGRIIGVTTSMNTMYREGAAPYGPSKAAHEAMIAMAARELEGTGVTVNVLVPGGMANTDLIPNNTTHSRDYMIQPSVMQKPVVWLASEESEGITGKRFIGYYWDDNLPIKERLEKSSAPAAWPQLGSQAIRLEPNTN